MNDLYAARRRGSSRPITLALAALIAAGAAGAYWVYYRGSDSDPPPPVAPSGPPADIAEQVHQFCGACHAYPPPDSFPRSAWKDEVERGYGFFGSSGMPIQPPRFEDVVRYFEDRAPAELPPARFERATTPVPVRFERISYPLPPGLTTPHISNVNLVHLYDERRYDILACEMAGGLVLALSPYEEAPKWKVLGKVDNPAHAEVVDLDGDGIKDILVADLGNFLPTDRRNGKVVWLRGNRDGSFTPHVLLKDVGRVADVQAADFRGTGKLDLVVAAFGWQRTGEIYLLENHTTDWSKPKFVPRVLDERHGGIHVPVADLNGDGKPDFVALISQEHEKIVAFINQGNGEFRKETIYSAENPGYGSSGIQLVDMNGDGKLDVLYTNGDVLDQPYLLKPYHSVQWLENRGSYPFTHHPITPMYGVHRAVAADLTGRNVKDVVAVSFLPAEAFGKQRKEMDLDAVILLEQTAPGRFARHSLESVRCDHVTCVAGDVFDRGRTDLVIGNFTSLKVEHAVTVWKNLGPAGSK
jgi:hypothetical protein